MNASTARALRLAFGLGLFAAAVWVAGPAALLRTVVGGDPVLLALGGGLYLTLVAIKTYRWRRVVALAGGDLPWRQALRAYGFGMILGAVTPGRVGQHIKALALVERGVAWERAVATTVVDQLLDMAVVAALVPLAVGFFGAAVSGSAGWGIGALGLAAAAIALAARLSRRRFAAAAAEVLRLGRRALGLPLALALASTALYFATLDAVGRAFGLRVGLAALSLASVAAAVIETAPVTVAGLGTREVALLALLGPLGAAPAAIVALTLVVRALQVGTGGLAYLAGSGRPPGRSQGRGVAPGSAP